MRELDIWLYHYSLLFPKQVELKGIYYSSRKNRPQVKGWYDWMKNSYSTLKRPYRVHNMFHYPGWLMRFEGTHPEEIIRMWEDIQSGSVDFEQRGTDDIEELLNTWWYPIGRYLLKIIEPIDCVWKEVIWNRVIGIWKH